MSEKSHKNYFACQLSTCTCCTVSSTPNQGPNALERRVRTSSSRPKALQPWCTLRSSEVKWPRCTACIHFSDCQLISSHESCRSRKLAEWAAYRSGVRAALARVQRIMPALYLALYGPGQLSTRSKWPSWKLSRDENAYNSPCAISSRDGRSNVGFLKFRGSLNVHESATHHGHADYAVAPLGPNLYMYKTSTFFAHLLLLVTLLRRNDGYSCSSQFSFWFSFCQSTKQGAMSIVDTHTNLVWL